ncbi:MAG TPA: type II secretion system F family protein [Longimicrobium sp.]|nr:type II secretion system F family protein [Longimicrobium sp.]
MIFAYEGIDAAGRHTRGRRDAEDAETLVATLTREGLRDVRARAALDPIALVRGKRVSRRDVALFTRLMASLLASTSSPAEALRLLQRLTRAPGLRAIVRQLALDIQAGVSVADAMEKHPRAFNRVYVNAVRAGEQSGRLREMLERLAEQMTRADAIRAKTQSAMVYPAAVLVMALCTAWYMLRNIVPTFAEILARSTQPIPPSTKILIGISTLLQHHGTLLLAVFAGTCIGIQKLSQNASVQDWAGARIARIPLFGNLINAGAMANFCGMFALIHETGIDVVQALSMATETIPNRRIARGVAASIPEVAQGGSISGALERTGVVPPLVPTIAEVGERTGTLSEQMKRVGADYFREHEQLAQLASTATEIIFITLVAVGIGAMVVTLWIPLFESTRAMGH